MSYKSGKHKQDFKNEKELFIYLKAFLCFWNRRRDITENVLQLHKNLLSYIWEYTLKAYTPLNSFIYATET